MTIINQGWYASCDNCGEPDCGSIWSGARARTKQDVRRDIIRNGWVIKGKWTYCCQECFEAAQNKQES